jgi:hypothetical protein
VSSYVTPFKGKISNLEFSDFDLDGVNGVKLGYDFQHTKSSLIELIWGTHIYVSMYIYFDPKFRISVGRIIPFFCIKSVRTADI